MKELGATLDWRLPEDGGTVIKGTDRNRFRAIGEFLQSYELPDVLNWDSIEKALPPLDPTNFTRSQHIRASLYQLGEIRAARGEIEDWSQRLEQGSAERLLERCPPSYRGYISRFHQWRANRMTNDNVDLFDTGIEPLPLAPRTILETTSIVVRFLNFCANQSITELTQIDRSVIHKYQALSLWLVECAECHAEIQNGELGSSGKCDRCGAVGSYVQKQRQARSTMTHNAGNIRCFFDWAKHEKLISENPFKGMWCGSVNTFTVRNHRGEATEIRKAIRRYEDSVIEIVCGYIVSPEAEPDEALVAYFTVFHLLTNAELRNLRIPSLVAPGVAAEDDLKYLILPLRNPTRGWRAIPRTQNTIIFPPEALSWLQPILKRWYAKRAELVKTKGQTYFFVGQKTAKCDREVTRSHITNLLEAASIEAMGAVVKPSDLRRTVADVFARNSKRRGAVLSQMGYSSLGANAFNYLERFTIAPKPAAEDACERIRRRRTARVAPVPSGDV